MYDTILLTEEVRSIIQTAMLEQARPKVPIPPGVITEAFGMKVLVVPDKFFDNIRTRDGKQCGAIFIEDKDIAESFPELKYTPIG